MSPLRVYIEISSDSDEEVSSLHTPSPFKRKTCHGAENEKGVSVIRIRSSKQRTKKKRESRDYDDDCIILDSDPEKRDFGFTVISSASKDLLLVAERGPVACRDYPHARHLCAKFHFKSTSHHKHCELCYCYVCDVLAPCSRWNNQRDNSHCHASDKEDKWKTMRDIHKLAGIAKK